MNRFANIKPLFKYNKVAYYSVTLDENDKTLYEIFVESQTKGNKNKLYHIQKWMQVIGEKYGAQNRFFRNEAYNSDTSALPPQGKNLEPTYIEHGKKKVNNLRLYCLRANEHVVFLYGGDLKTTKKAQDCPNVRSHFLLANELTKSIDQAIIDKDIKWIEDYTLIDCDPDLKLYY